jgi:hypothetical protein
MSAKLQKITVTIENKIFQWVRLEAARNETSVSRLLGWILRERMLEKDAYETAMGCALARKAFLKTDGHYLSRKKAHARARLR